MQVFKNILVGVDLAQWQPDGLAAPNPIVMEPIEWGIRLARLCSARLTFFSAANISEETLSPLAEEDRSHVRQAVMQAGGKVLQNLVEQAHGDGVDARAKIMPGKGWHEIIRQVLHERHDLVIVGTRNVTSIRRMLFGNTSMKLFRRCPCPVLVTKVGTDARSLNILVATDLKPASDDALRLGIALTRQMNARLHVLHVVEYKLDDICSIGLPSDKQSEYRRRIRAHAEALLEAQLRTTDYKSLGDRIQVHLASGVGVGVPDVAIQHFIQLNQIHLLVMGTIGRGGIRGIMISNTAERLLPEVHCSILAVKPPDFVCPVEP